ncbi:fructose 1,6-bisphosphatase [Microbacterium sp. NPDC077644]|uniref:fructose 1,6-bisphosphatase n=1 Tax=Microbacterium sp. NPDC077644 TaxID=3155055 RepID=UPI00344C6FD2
MPPLTRRPRRAARATAAIAIIAALSATTGCAQIFDVFNGVQSTEIVTPTAQPDAKTPPEDLAFDSQFTRDGSVSLSSDVAEDLEVRLDFWAADPKRTMEWTPQGEKTFGFAVNVYDHRVDEKAVLTDKRRVYISQISITSQTSQTSNQSSSPFQFSADPRTLVPTDTLRSDRGLLLNSFQGGLLVPETTIHQLPDDTYGITLQFAITVSVEGNANDDTSFQQQMVYQVLPIAIYPASADDAAE